MHNFGSYPHDIFKVLEAITKTGGLRNMYHAQLTHDLVANFWPVLLRLL